MQTALLTPTRFSLRVERDVTTSEFLLVFESAPGFQRPARLISVGHLRGRTFPGVSVPISIGLGKVRSPPLWALRCFGF
jgi:hypothetical protein